MSRVMCRQHGRVPGRARRREIGGSTDDDDGWLATWWRPAEPCTVFCMPATLKNLHIYIRYMPVTVYGNKSSVGKKTVERGSDQRCLRVFL